VPAVIEDAWLRDLGDPDVLDYLRAERAHHDGATAHLRGLRQALAEEITGRAIEHGDPPPWRWGAARFRIRGDALLRLDPVTGTERVLLDAGSGGYPPGQGLLELSPDELLLAYDAPGPGGRGHEIRFRDVVTGTDTADRLPVRGEGDGRPWRTSGAWSADSRDFVYAARPRLVRAHRLGTDPVVDPVVQVEPDADCVVGVHAGREGSWILLTSESAHATQTHVLRTDAIAEPPRLVAARRPGVRYAVALLPGGWDGGGADRMLMVTNDGDEEFRLLDLPVPPGTGSGDPAEADEPGRVVVAATAGEGGTVTGVEVLARHLVVLLRREGEPVLRVIDRSGRRRTRDVHPGAPHGHLRLCRQHSFDASSMVFVEENQVLPPAWVELDLDTGVRRVIGRVAVPGVELSRYATERVWARAADGVQVPVTLARRRDVTKDGEAAAVLSVFGAYGRCHWPAFDPAVLSLLDRGVVVAIVHVRGGGELGGGWWRQGRGAGKRVAVGDLIAARDTLVELGYCASDRVAVRGRAAGGFLAAAAASLSPGRWRAVLVESPLVDPLGSVSPPGSWLPEDEHAEWGLTDDPDAPGTTPRQRRLTAMLACSPYHRIPDADHRPALMVTGELSAPIASAPHPGMAGPSGAGVSSTLGGRPAAGPAHREPGAGAAADLGAGVLGGLVSMRGDAGAPVHEAARWVAALRTSDPDSVATLLFRAETTGTGPVERAGREVELLAWLLDAVRAAVHGVGDVLEP